MMISQSSAPIGSIQFLGILFVVSLVIDLIGFYRTVWFISIGYAASIAAFVIVTVVVFVFPSDEVVLMPPPAASLQLLAALIWGMRLGLFLAAREQKALYRASIQDQTDKSQSLSLSVKIAIWLSTSLLYVCMFSPIVFLVMGSYKYSRVSAEDADNKPNNNNATIAAATSSVGITWLGVGITWLGLGLEAWADHQKSAAKNNMANSSNTFVCSGLYAWVRYPNYLGEITFWLGIFCSGIIGYHKIWWHWAMAVNGLACIILIMMGSTKRLEKKQAERYGHDAAFKHYIQTVPVIFPWIPIYSLRNVKVYLE